MPNTKRDKYDKVADDICNRFAYSVPDNREEIARMLRSAFPPPAEDARRCAKKGLQVYGLTTYGHFDEDDYQEVALQKAAAEISRFAESRVEPWREALEEFEAWWRLPNIARSVETIEPAMRKCLSLLTDSPVKEKA